MVLNAGYAEFLKRIPDFSVAPDFTPSYKTGATRQLVALPLIFDSATASSAITGQETSR
jgi:hypothetical protein